MAAPHPLREDKKSVTKSSRYLDQRQGGYFLFFIFRMAMIKFAVAIITINSSYVLIITTPFVRPPKQVEAALPVARVRILYCQSASGPIQFWGQDHCLYIMLLLPSIDFSIFFTSNVLPVKPRAKEYIIWLIQYIRCAFPILPSCI